MEANFTGWLVVAAFMIVAIMLAVWASREDYEQRWKDTDPPIGTTLIFKDGLKPYRRYKVTSVEEGFVVMKDIGAVDGRT